MLLSRSTAETRRIAAKIARKAIKAVRSAPAALVFSLEGGLGAGKTTFTQGFAKGLGIRARILSPTFVLMKRYRLPASSSGQPLRTAPPHAFYHLDCYRLGNPAELLALGWKDIVRDPHNIVLVEWGDRVRRIMPRSRFNILFRVAGVGKRRIAVAAAKKRARPDRKK